MMDIEKSIEFCRKIDNMTDDEFFEMFSNFYNRKATGELNNFIDEMKLSGNNLRLSTSRTKAALRLFEIFHENQLHKINEKDAFGSLFADIM